VVREQLGDRADCTDAPDAAGAAVWSATATMNRAGLTHSTLTFRSASVTQPVGRALVLKIPIGAQMHNQRHASSDITSPNRVWHTRLLAGYQAL
jgi:hypothetical protein